MMKNRLMLNGDAPLTALIYGLSRNAESVTLVRAWLDSENVVQCNNQGFYDDWCSNGIVGRHTHGRLYPKDGRVFIEELPYVYRGGYVRAEVFDPEARRDR